MSKRMWGGRFKGRLDPRIDALNRSLSFDRRLFAEDIEASVAFAEASPVPRPESALEDVFAD